MASPVVTGHVMKQDEPHIYGDTTNVQSANDSTWKKGEKQPGGCNDVIWGVLFYCQIAALIAVAGVYGGDMWASQSYYAPYIYASGVTGAFAFIFSGISILVMIACAEVLIKISLFFVVGLSFVWAVISFIAGVYFSGIMFVIFFLIGLCYIKVVWDRIPFATANLVTSLTAVKANIGIVLVAYIVTAVAFVWAIIWSFALAGIYEELCGDQGCDAEEYYPYGYLFLMLVSYFWTLQVLMNVVHVTVAGVVGTWWLSPADANCCCSGAIFGSFIRSITTSFGSICLGSLIVAVIQAIRQLAYTARQNDDGNACLICIAECILSCIQGIVEYFNKWAYIYVGVYGYSYCEAGKNVMQLFRDRGWDVIIADDLVGNALFLVSIIIGLITGCVGMILAKTKSFDDLDEDEALIAFFILGLIIGLMLACILMTVVASGVNTVIVCFADAPAEFQTNHPELSNRMRQTWISAFPGCM